MAVPDKCENCGTKKGKFDGLWHDPDYTGQYLCEECYQKKETL